MSVDIFKSCMRTPKSGKIFWKGQGILKSLSAGHSELVTILKSINQPQSLVWVEGSRKYSCPEDLCYMSIGP